MRTPPHLAHEPLLLHLAPELAKRLLELLWILDDYPHNPTRIQAEPQGTLVKSGAVLTLTQARRTPGLG